MINKIKFLVILLTCVFPLVIFAQTEFGTRGIGFYAGICIPSYPNNFSNYDGGPNLGIYYNLHILKVLKITPCLSYFNFVATLNDAKADEGGYLNVISLSFNLSQKLFDLFKSNRIYIREGIGYYYSKMSDFVIFEDGSELRYKAEGNQSYLGNLGIEIFNNIENNISVSYSIIYNFLGLDKNDRKFISLRLGFNYYFK